MEQHQTFQRDRVNLYARYINAFKLKFYYLPLKS